jgi:signal transduction histidine kinase
MLFETALNIIINSFFESIIVLLLYLLIIGQIRFIENNKLKSVLFIVIYVTFSLWADTFIASGIRSLVYIFFHILLLSSITKFNLLSSLIVVAIITIFSFAAESFTLLFFMLIMEKDLSAVVHSAQFKLIGGFIVRSLQFLSIYLLYKSRFNLFNFRLFKKKSYVISTGLLQEFLFCIFIEFFLFGVQDEKKTVLFQLVTLQLSALIITISIIDFIERDKVLKLNYQFKIQEANVRNMEKIINILRESQHDIGNHLNTILSMTQTEDINNLKKINSYVCSINNNIKLSYKSYDTGNDYINGLLAVKYNYVQEKGIKFEVDFEAKLSLIDLSDHALISIMSNIIDNAAQAIENESSKDKKFISVSGYIENDKYILSICNNGPAIPEQCLGKIFESGYSTKDNENKDHGFGLYIVKQYVVENAGEISVSSSEDETEFLIRFPIKRQF